MKKKVKKNIEKDLKDYFSKISRASKETKLDKRFTFVFILDLIYTFALTTLGLSLLWNFFEKAGPVITNLSSGSLGEQELIANLFSLSGFLILKSIAIGIIVYSILYVLLKGIIWRRVVRQKISLIYYGKLILFNLLFILALIIIFFITGISRKLFIIPYILLVLLIHFYYISLISFSKSNNLFQGIKQGFKKAWKIWLFIIPYLILIIIYYAKTVIINLVSTLLSSNLSLIPLTENSSFIDVINFLQQTAESIPKLIPFIIISGIIAAFFKTYSRIFYAEFVQTQ